MKAATQGGFRTLPTPDPRLEDTVLDAGPDAPFKNNVSAYLALRALAVPDGVHNRAQRRALSKRVRKGLGRAALAEIETLLTKGRTHDHA